MDLLRKIVAKVDSDKRKESWKAEFDSNERRLVVTQENTKSGTTVYDANASLFDLESVRMTDVDEDSIQWLVYSFLYYSKSTIVTWTRLDGETVERHQHSISLPFPKGANAERIVDDFRQSFSSIAFRPQSADEIPEVIEIEEALRPVFESQLPNRYGTICYDQRVSFDKSTLILTRTQTRLICGNSNSWRFPLLSGDENGICYRRDGGGFSVLIPCAGFLETCCVWTPPTESSPDQRTEKSFNIVFPEEEDAAILVDLLKEVLGSVRAQLIEATWAERASGE